MKPFSFIYYLLSVVLYILALPLLISLSFKKKYKESVPSRFFLFNNPGFKNSNGIWFHVCSLGESRALKPILDKIDKENVKITTITHTGQNEAKKYGVDLRYLPYEMFLPLWIKPQKILVVLEAEFWYMLFAVVSARGGKVVLLNARISDKSVKKYMKMGWFYKRLLSHVNIIFCQSEIDALRFATLGAKNVEVVGNIKLAQVIKESKEYEKPSTKTIVAASTHDGEEKIILAGYKKYLQENKAKLIVVPRHPERFEEVYRLLLNFCNENALHVSRFSEDKSLSTDVVLVDMMGELNNIYRISDIAVLGGAFKADVGGHNPLEPAHFGCKIITGKHFYDQRELFKYVHHVQYIEDDELFTALQEADDLPPSSVDEKIDLDRVIKYIES
ncbi:lipid IV(A) 3-deoxy-D-manno-octulosonic acid transferase [bacterium]|nr:lipid IV(A) 3-deoxy-D-manno-octulosonic acid transferase [bacterium]MBU1884754.1 lipid IV(A) 3-deoxy-D-manno-octulosonic acid transferase [bacterium]